MCIVWMLLERPYAYFDGANPVICYSRYGGGFEIAFLVYFGVSMLTLCILSFITRGVKLAESGVTAIATYNTLLLSILFGLAVYFATTSFFVYFWKSIYIILFYLSNYIILVFPKLYRITVGHKLDSSITRHERRRSVNNSSLTRTVSKR